MSKKGVYIINNEEIFNILLADGKLPEGHNLYTEDPIIFERLRKINLDVASLTFLSSLDLKELDRIVFNISTQWQQTINRFCHEKAQCKINIGDTLSIYIFRFLSLF